MSGRREEDFGAIAWPGFVDILSAVIIMFVFFVMIVASALYFHIIIFKSKIESETVDSLSKTTETEELFKGTNKESMKVKLEEMSQQMEVLEKVVAQYDVQFFQEASEFTKSKDQKLVEVRQGVEVVIMFGKDAISLTKETKERLNAIIAERLENFDPATQRVKIVSGMDPNHVSEAAARKLSVARMFNTRNVFLDTKPRIDVVAKTGKKETVENSYHWVRLVFEDKE